MNDYIIEYKGLINGVHQFEFPVGDRFFEGIKDSQIEKGELLFSVSLVKKTNLLSLETEITGEVEVECDRCLEKYMQYIDFEGNLFARVKDREVEGSDTDEDIIFLTSDDHCLELKQYVYESIVLSLPFKKMHPGEPGETNGCNQEMINRINQHVVSDEQHETDPRWDKLKSLMTKNN